MKISPLICLFFAICSPILLSAQQTIKIGENRTAENTFIVNKVQTQANTSSKNMLINDKKMTKTIEDYRSEAKRMQEPQGLRYSKRGSLHLVFIKVLGEEKIKKLSPERLLVTMIYNSNGKVTAVLFTIKEDTKLSLEEIERLSFAIEENITFSFSSVNFDKNKKLVPYNHSIHLNKILHQMSAINQSKL